MNVSGRPYCLIVTDLGINYADEQHTALGPYENEDEAKAVLRRLSDRVTRPHRFTIMLMFDPAEENELHV